MRTHRIQIVLAAITILGAAVLAKVLQPRELLASSYATLNLHDVIPRQFGIWKLVPEASPITPAEPEDYVQPGPNSSRIYTQEVGRVYTDGDGHIVMLEVAYGPVQNFRLKAHRPEMCYTAAGFRVSPKSTVELSYRKGSPPIPTARLTAEREGRFEPITYWMRVGNGIATGVIDRQMLRLKYGLRGIIPDGALIRISTIGMPKDASYNLQEKFIRDLLAAIPPTDLTFFVGKS